MLLKTRKPPMRIDELRKRLLEERNRLSGAPANPRTEVPRPVSIASNQALRSNRIDETPKSEPALSAQDATAGASGEAEVMNELNQLSVASAIGKSFERTKAFEERFANLMSTFEQADRLAQQAIEAVEQLGELADHLPSLVKAFEPMKAVKRQLAALSKAFEPMKPAEEQIAEFSQAFSKAFHENLVRIARMLEPVRDFQTRLAELASDFSPANDLQKRFDELAHAFDESPAEEPASTAVAQPSEQSGAEQNGAHAEEPPALNGTIAS